MDRYERICILNTEVEARLLESVLVDRGIPHRLLTYRDSALDGLFQAAQGWGRLEAPPEHRDGIVALLDEIRARASEAGGGAREG